MINTVTFSGTIAQITVNGMVSILLAHEEEYEKDGQQKQKTDFVWIKTTQKVFQSSTFSKGDAVKVRGKLTGGQYFSQKEQKYLNNLSIFAFSISHLEEEEEAEDLPTPDDEIKF